MCLPNSGFHTCILSLEISLYPHFLLVYLLLIAHARYMGLHGKPILVSQSKLDFLVMLVL